MDFIDCELDNQPAIVIGGGPSAQGVNFHALSGYFIAVNDAFRHAPHDLVVSIDGRWMGNRWRELVGKRCWLRADSYEKHTEGQTWDGLTLGECAVFEPPPGDGLHRIHANNSGLAAIVIAYWLGFKTIYGYGFDNSIPLGSEKHWYPEYEWAPKGNHMYPDFKRAAEQFRQAIPHDVTIKIVGHTTLTCFEKITHDQAANDLARVR